jgi:hypothetical protein
MQIVFFPVLLVDKYISEIIFASPEVLDQFIFPPLIIVVVLHSIYAYIFACVAIHIISYFRRKNVASMN